MMASIKVNNFIQLARKFGFFARSIEMGMLAEELELFTCQSSLTILNERWHSLEINYSELALAAGCLDSWSDNSSPVRIAYETARDNFNCCRSTIYQKFSEIRSTTTDPFLLDFHPTLVDEVSIDNSDQLAPQSHGKEHLFSHFGKKSDTFSATPWPDWYIDLQLTCSSTDLSTVEAPSASSEAKSDFLDSSESSLGVFAESCNSTDNSVVEVPSANSLDPFGGSKVSAENNSSIASSVPLTDKPKNIKCPYNFMGPSFGLLFAVEANPVAQSFNGLC